MGSFVLDVLDSEHVVRQFDASFLVRMWDGMCGQDGVGGQCGGEGMSFCFGALPPYAMDEEGVDDGLCIRSLACTHKRLEVVYDGVVLSSVWLTDAMLMLNGG